MAVALASLCKLGLTARRIAQTADYRLDALYEGLKFDCAGRRVGWQVLALTPA